MDNVSSADLSAIANGGEDFLKRLKQFSDAQAMAKQAFDDLNLGRAAVDAKNDADLKLNQANKALYDARQEAEAIVAKANEQASALVAEADSNAKNMIADAKAKLDKDTQDTRQQLAIAHDSLTRLQDEANRKNAEASRALDEANAVLEKAKADDAKAAQLRSDLRASIHEAIKSVLAEV